ncbi:serine hydrolase, partial [Aquiflexum sp.]|uniref:serine hydrolase n=1 Tax=Aquiflexum sp. TaxID=1872584 RepID=UPI0035933E2A
TAEDLAKFAVNIQQTLKGGPETVLSKDMTALMLTPFVEDFTGLGFFINKMKDEIYFGHGGWDEGFSSELIAHKDKGYGVVILTNSNHPEFISELIRSVALTYDWDEFVPVYQRKNLNPGEINQIIGRYKIGGNMLIEIFQNDNVLYSKGLMGESKEFVKISDSTFIGRDNNQPVVFKTKPETNKTEMVLLNPNTGVKEGSFSKMDDGEKIPIELLVAGDFDLALKEYQAMKKRDPNDPTIAEDNLNILGYRFMENDKLKISQDIFKINTILYPNSSNVYDSYAEASMEIGEIDLAIENYKKSLSLDPQNANAEKMIAELQKKKGG